MGVLQVRAGVAGGLHHPGHVEDVVLVQPGGQVGVLDRGHRDRRRGLLLRGVQQGVEGDRRALPGGELLAVGPEHLPERDVLGAYVVGQEAGQPGDGEDLVEVEGLRGSDDVDDPVGVQVADAVPDRGQVGGGVAVAAVGLAHDHRRVEPLDEDAQRAVVDHRDAGLLELGDDRGQVVVVDRLPGQVGVGEQHAEPRVRGVEAGLGDLQQLLPDLPGLRIAGLQRDHPAAGGGGELRVGLEARVGPLVDRLGAPARSRSRTSMPSSQDLLDQHAELGAPVADVVLRDHPMTDRRQHPVQAVADDRRAQVAHMHLLGHVGRGVVDHHRLRVVGRHDAERRVGELVGHRFGQHLGAQPEVEKAGPGDLRRLAQVGDLQPGHDLGRPLARRRPSALARRSATLDWKWPNWGLVAGRSSGSTPVTASIRALSSDGKGGHSRPLFHRSRLAPRAPVAPPLLARRPELLGLDRACRSGGTADPAARTRTPVGSAAGHRWSTALLASGWRTAAAGRAAPPGAGWHLADRGTRVDALQEEQLGPVEGADPGQVALVQQGFADAALGLGGDPAYRLVEVPVRAEQVGPEMTDDAVLRPRSEPAR